MRKLYSECFVFHRVFREMHSQNVKCEKCITSLMILLFFFLATIWSSIVIANCMFFAIFSHKLVATYFSGWENWFEHIAFICEKTNLAYCFNWWENWCSILLQSVRKLVWAYCFNFWENCWKRVASMGEKTSFEQVVSVEEKIGLSKLFQSRRNQFKYVASYSKKTSLDMMLQSVRKPQTLYITG